MNDRTPQIQLWTWPPTAQPGRLVQPARPVQPTEPVRIGDAERDEAASSLGDHFAAGRLTREEFDTRADQAMVARYDSDLQPLFADLPQNQPAPVVTPAKMPAARNVLPMMLLQFLPFLMIGAVVTAVVLSAPWLLWTLVWVAVMGSMLGRGRPRYHHR